jgi:hypothetical protein
MAGPAPKTRNWHALENAHKPKGLHVLVFGEVEVTATDKEPRLTETPERNPKNLGLKLTIETLPGEGADVVVWKGVHFHKEVKKDQFDHVIVRWDVGQIANFPIHDDREQAASAAAAMKALNQQHAAKGQAAKPAAKKSAAKEAAPKTPASKKAAPKKAAAKKAAPKKAAAKKKPRAVGGWAKGKKATRKAAKKSAARRAKKRAPGKKKRR